jgi:hypothetical protein
MGRFFCDDDCPQATNCTEQAIRGNRLVVDNRLTLIEDITSLTVKFNGMREQWPS